MNFDTPPQALTICGEWNKIFEDTRHKRQAAPDCLFVAGGLLLLVPLGLIGAAFGILKFCA